MSRHTIATALVALVFTLLAAPAQAMIHLSFGLYSSNKPTAMVKQFRPVLDIIEKRMTEMLGTRVKIRIQVAKDYPQGIEHLASGKVDFSRFGPASYVEAKRANSGLRILAMERVRGDKVFYGIIAVAKDSPINSMEDLHGRSFAFGNDQSTIGRYLSQLYLRNHGILSANLSRFDYLGRHDKVGTAVGAGHFEAGALNEATFAKLVAKGVPIRELARFPNVTKPWIAREGLPERLFAALRDALLATSDPILVKTLKADGFVPGGDTDYVEIRDAIEMNSKFFEAPTALASADPATSDSSAEDSLPAQAGDLDGSGVAAAGTPAVVADEPVLSADWQDGDIDVPGTRPLDKGVGWAEADIDIVVPATLPSFAPVVLGAPGPDDATAQKSAAESDPASAQEPDKAAESDPALDSRGVNAAASAFRPQPMVGDTVRIQ